MSRDTDTSDTSTGSLRDSFHGAKPKPVPGRTGTAGSILFETFVALMILSVGITATLRIFGQALFVSTRGIEKKAAEERLDRFLFKWFADPRKVALAGGGSITFSLDPEKPEEEFWCVADSHELIPAEEALQGTEPPAKPKAVRENRYYQVQFRVKNVKESNVMDLEGLIYHRSSGGVAP